jgi:flagellar motor switch protein FliM
MTEQGIAEAAESETTKATSSDTQGSAETKAAPSADPAKDTVDGASNVPGAQTAAGEETAGAAGAPEDAASEDATDATGEVKYDFTRPWTISNKFHQNLVSIAEAFANQLSFSMSNYLRTTVDVAYQSVKQELFSDYLDQLPEAKCIGVFSMPPLKGQSVFTVDGELMFVILDKLIGGQGKAHEVGRDFTEIETRIFMLVMNKFLSDYREAAKKFFESSIHLNRIESNPAFIAVMTGGEKVIAMSLEMTIGDQSGVVMVAAPMSGFDPVMSALDPNEDTMIKRHDIPPEDKAKIVSALQESSVDVTAVLGRAKITLNQLLHMETGDTIILDQRMNEPIAVRIGKKTVCYGEPGKSQNRKAVKVVSGI